MQRPLGLRCHVVPSWSDSAPTVARHPFPPTDTGHFPLATFQLLAVGYEGWVGVEGGGGRVKRRRGVGVGAPWGSCVHAQGEVYLTSIGALP